MDERSLYFIYILTSFILINLPKSDAIRCYECTSFPGSGCGFDFRPHHLNLIDCNKDSSGNNIYDSYKRPLMCKKVISKTTDGLVIHRGCMSNEELEELNSDEMCATKPFNQDVVCRCDTDRCNDAISQRYNVHLGLVLFLSIFVAVNYH